MQINYPVLNGNEQQDTIDDAYGPLFGLPMSFATAGSATSTSACRRKRVRIRTRRR